MQSLICKQRDLPAQLSSGIFTDRKRQFVDRLQWDLCLTPAGQELDEYDDEESDYLVVHDKGRHMGSCRVRPTTSNTMITDHFLDSFQDADHFLTMQKGRMYELTRFCRSPDISADQSKEMLSDIGSLMDQFRDQKNLTGFVAVVFPKVARFMDTIGMRYVIISQSKVNGQLTYMICITQGTSIKANVSKLVFEIASENMRKLLAA